ncbi:inositol monophosphatase family protein [Pleurocapsa sp. PCC 7319]|uniref:inositol monophosphatase family protein n=1 Tax=Pleurocapsa sp. PCC 7319 TaxID=118161 RepID=UPI00034ABD1B|nr:inositol monophosphatase family protein [Pleurocapsa sp. PCC 7319]
MNEFWDQVLNFCVQTTQNISERLIKDFGKIQASKKEDGSLVTQADRWSDQEIRRAIATTFPEHGILSEETIHILPENDWCWVIDPIDGTTNFTRGVPVWAISLGLLYRGTPVFGFVHVPMLNQSFHGFWYGNSGLTGYTGAYLNNQPIHTSQDQPDGGQLFNLCARSTAIFQQPFPCKVRMIGVASYNLLLVAEGVVIGGVEATPKIWDIAAAWAIVKAAGGEFVFLDNNFQFPLQVGQDYGQVSIPSLGLCRAELIPMFKPLVERVVKK